MWNIMRIFVLLLFVPIGVSSAFSPQESSDISQIVSKNGNAIVMIFTMSEDKEIHQGSGFVIKSDGLIITNYHVIQGAEKAGVRLISGKIFEDISIVKIDEEKDIAVIKVNGSSLPIVKLGDSDLVKSGDKIIVIGNPQGLENSVTDGLISGIRDIDETYTVHQISAPISSGSSGSPVFNLEGEVIGIAMSSFTEGQNLNFSIPINYIRTILGETIARRSEAVPTTPTAAAVASQGGGTKIPLRKRPNLGLVGILFISLACIILIAFIIVAINRRDKKSADIGQKISAKLNVNLGSGERSSFIIQSEYTSIGRDGNNSVILDDSLVSARHAEIIATDKGFLLKDLESSNGTFVNGKKISECYLFLGDEISIGSSKLKLDA